jgi:hypothetical protein
MSSAIKLEIDQESFDEAKRKMQDLARMADTLNEVFISFGVSMDILTQKFQNLLNAMPDEMRSTLEKEVGREVKP